MASGFCGAAVGRLGVCGQCGENPARYRCPGCSAVTCSLGCVRDHKTTGCTGKRRRSDFARSVRDMNDQTIANDFHLMEDGSRFIGASKRGFTVALWLLPIFVFLSVHSSLSVSSLLRPCASGLPEEIAASATHHHAHVTPARR